MPMLPDTRANPLGPNVTTFSVDRREHLIAQLFLAAGEVLPLFLQEFVPLAQEHLFNVKKIMSMERLSLPVQDRSWDCTCQVGAVVRLCR